eukprot:Skav217674  [mRNA]  locus=scaffold2919:313137:314651:- [translate_table: standard]
MIWQLWKFQSTAAGGAKCQCQSEDGVTRCCWSGREWLQQWHHLQRILQLLLFSRSTLISLIADPIYGIDQSCKDLPSEVLRLEMFVVVP